MSGQARWLAVAPGRVNLIGDHIDYVGLPVLPIAIDRDVRVEFRMADEPVVRLTNVAARFAPFAFRLDRPIEAAARGDWSNYVRAAARGLLDHGVPLRRGIAGTVDGDVPIASGLSSSSALVVASALALLRANGVAVGDGARTGAGAGVAGAGAGNGAGVAGRGGAGRGGAGVSTLELAAIMARAERFVGLEGGGMDQAACLHGVAGHALRIDFDPLRVAPVPVPEAWRWVVGSSLARAEKSGDVRDAYNARARQSRAALRAVGGAGRVAGHGAGAVAGAVAELTTTDNIEALLRHARGMVDATSYHRFRHVVSEGRRVVEAERAMLDGDMRRFGDLMVRSHASFRDDYEVSTEALDEIVAVAVEAGAAGARLTGAGFGGCAVALCDERTVARVMEALAARFYLPRLGRPPSGAELFTATASGGARVAGA